MSPAELEVLKIRSAARREGRLYEHPLPLTHLMLDAINQERLRERQAEIDGNPLTPGFDACYGDSAPKCLIAPGAERKRCRVSGPRPAPARRRKQSRR